MRSNEKIATLAKLIGDHLPKDLTMTKESKDFIGECCLEFIHLLASESTEICENKTRKMMNGEHVLGALKSLGFEGFIEPVQGVMEEFNRTAKDREKKTSKLEDSGLSAEELLKSQEELFARARQRMISEANTPITPTVPTFVQPETE